MPKPDRSRFARQNALALGLFFLALLAFAGWRGNVFAGIAGLLGLVWVIWAHLSKD